MFGPKGIAVALGITLVLLVILVSCFFLDPSASNCRKIAADLLELQRQWETSDDARALFQSLTNLPFQEGAAIDHKAWVYHRFSILGLQWEEYYFIETPRPVATNSEWTLYHEWGWLPSQGGHRELALHKLASWRTR